MSNTNKSVKKQVKETVSKVQQVIAHPSVSALIYGYLKEKNLNLKEMSVDQWKEIEKDLVEIVLAEVFPGEEAPENQLTFTSLANSIAFMSRFIQMLDKNAGNKEESVGQKTKPETKEPAKKFEL